MPFVLGSIGARETLGVSATGTIRALHHELAPIALRYPIAKPAARILVQLEKSDCVNSNKTLGTDRLLERLSNELMPKNRSGGKRCRC